MINSVVRTLERSQPPAVVMSVGIPASGKSTYFEALGRTLETPVIEVDAIRRRLLAERPGSFSFAAFENAIDDQVARHIAVGGVALLDSTNAYKAERDGHIRRFRELGARTIGAVQFDIPLQTALARDENRAHAVGQHTIASMHQALLLEPPMPREGFDWIESVAH